MTDDSGAAEHAIGRIRMDTTTGRVGIVIDVRETGIDLRGPTHGARAWTAKPEDLRIATREEITHAYLGKRSLDAQPSRRDVVMGRVRGRGHEVVPGVTVVRHDES
ncbi:hypothetical protein [Streptomyces violaceusniger]|nr:hypothetical protein [Streptomyces violaceusniger]